MATMSLAQASNILERGDAGLIGPFGTDLLPPMSA